jgi:hypothetical protein
VRIALAVAAFGCGSHDTPGPPPPPPPALDPDGPCVVIDLGACTRHDPHFAAARRVAVEPVAGRADSHQLIARDIYALHVTGSAGKRCLRVHAGSDARYVVRDWAPGEGGWITSENAFTPAEPGATFDLELAARSDLLVSVESEPKSDFRVVLGPCPL